MQSNTISGLNNVVAFLKFFDRRYREQNPEPFFRYFPILEKKQRELFVRPLMDTQTQKEISDILDDPNYDQSMLIAWFKNRFGDQWRLKWNHYLETGYIPKFYGDRS